MAFDLCLHPDLIDDVIEDLFEMDVITQEQIKKLKNDHIPADPNIVMDVRHKEAKNESLIDFDSKRKTHEDTKKKSGNISKESPKKVKDLQEIDREILKTRKCLEEFQKKLEKKNDCLENSILNLEKKNKAFYKENIEEEEKESSLDVLIKQQLSNRTEGKYKYLDDPVFNFEEEKEEHIYCKYNMKEDERDSPAVIKLNEQETFHYFNLHLDRLENAMNKNRQKNELEIWRPVEAKSPLINVITTLKDYEIRSNCLMDDEEIKFPQEHDLKSCNIASTSVDNSSEIQVNGAIPNNSPAFNVNVTFDEKNKLNTLNTTQYKIIQKTLKKWKLYTKVKKIKKWSEGRVTKMRAALLKTYFCLWVSYTKQLKDNKNKSLMESSNTLQIVPAKCCINTKSVGMSNFCVTDDFGTDQDWQKKNSDGVPIKSSTTKKVRSEITCNKVVIPVCKRTKEKCLPASLENTPEQTEVHVKTLTPQDVGLVQSSNKTTSQVCKKNTEKRVLEIKDNMTSRSVGEPLLHRFEAQEKIIKHQRELIEKQNRIIFDLQAKCVEIECKLNWTLAERQLAEAEMQVKKGPVSSNNNQERKTENKFSKHTYTEGSTFKIQDKSDIIVKNMLQRQAYCSQLAEKTKLRKIRLEEEKERLKLEQEEKQKQEKEEERKKRLAQIKIEQQIAQEKERIAIAQKKIEAELIEKAIKHYRNCLLQRCFRKLKTICLEVEVKAEDCDRIYKRKLIFKMFKIWHGKTKQSIQSKNEFADRYYNERLLRKAWDKLRKAHYDYKLRVQVSEDLYSLKLQERMFRMWQAFVAQQFLQQCCKIELAERLHRRQLLRHYFHYWKELPRMMFKEREKEQRRRVWRQTVQQLIPDFTPAYVDEI